jgi:hypothetical protein
MPAPELVAAAVRGRINGSVVAPAGYGKTETLADLVADTAGRCLLLTHTLAGVDALKKRLKGKGCKAGPLPARYHCSLVTALRVLIPEDGGLRSVPDAAGAAVGDGIPVRGATFKHPHPRDPRVLYPRPCR